jgi:hypothetical protein
MAFPSLIVEVGFATVASTGAYWHIGDSARGRIVTAAVGPDTFWEDVTADVRSFQMARGSSRLDGPIVHYDAGTCTVELDNRSRDYDPTNTASPFTGQVTPRRAFRVRATVDSVTYSLFRGSVDSWVQNYPDPSNNLATTTVTATDATKVLQRQARTAVAAVGGGEDAGARVTRILDSVGWAAEDRVISTGDSTLQETQLEGDPLSELLMVQDSEVGELYVDGAGRVVFRNRLAILSEARSNTSQATFGDGGGAELPYQQVIPEYDDAVLFNTVRATRAGGSAQTATDAASVTANLESVFEGSDLILETDAAARDWAGFILHQTKDPELRFATLTFTPRNGDATTEAALFAQALGREIGDRVTVRRRPPGGGPTIERDVFVRGISHETAPDLRWQTMWTFQSATTFEFWTIGHPTLGRIDHGNALAF